MSRPRILTCALVVLAFGTGLLARNRENPRVVEAESFVLKGPDGAIRARMEVDAEGYAVFALNDQTGSPRLVHRVADAGWPITELFDSKGQVRLVQTISDKDTTVLAMLDPKGQPRLKIGTDGRGERGSIRGLDSRGTPRFSLTAEDDESGLSVGFGMGGAKSLITVTNNKVGRPKIRVQDAEGKLLFETPDLPEPPLPLVDPPKVKEGD